MKHQVSLRSKIARLTVLLAGVVAFCTAWALILPAITITDDAATEDEGFYLEEEQGAGEWDMPAQSFAATVKAEDGLSVGVAVDADEGTFPAGVTMQAVWVTDDAVLEAAKAEAVSQTSMEPEDARMLAVDIIFTDVDGNTVEPAKPVHVALVSQDIARQDELAVVHVDDGNQAQMIAEDDSQPHLDTVCFDAEQFSVYALVYTVDFHYELDGQAYEFSMAGGDAISLGDMLAILQVVQADEGGSGVEAEVQMAEGSESVAENEGASEKPLASDLIADIATVEFTDESLLKVVPIESDTTAGALKEALGLEPEYSDELTEEGIANIDAHAFTAPDWALLSLKAFDTDEVLTVTLHDGEAFEIKITDRASNGQWEVWFDGTLGQSAQMNRFYVGASNVRTTAGNNAQVTLPAVGQSFNGQQVTAPSQYGYVLNGWYEVTGTGADKQANWHAVGDTVTITKDTVFYADWVPANYNKGPSGGYIDTVDTSGFVTTEMFDYNELLNVNFTGNPAVSINRPNPWYPGMANVHSETWNANSDFAFISWNYDQNPRNSIGMPGNRTDASQYRTTNLTPGIYGRNTDTINKLFDGSAMVGKTIVGTGNYLFNYNEDTGYYYYDSDINAATYNQGDGRFYVYDNREYITEPGASLTNYLPYNDYPGGSVPKNTGATNYWFGMKNTINFTLIDDVGTPGNPSDNKVNGEDMKFRFSGDDDVWVFVDGQLVLDLGGIHDRASGTINFATGEVTTYFGTLNTHNTPEVTTTNAALASLKEGSHTLTVLYLERGSSFSNCSIYFNLLPAPQPIALAKQIVDSAGAELTGAELDAYRNQEFTYEVRVGETLENSELYNTPANPKQSQMAIYAKQNGTTELIAIANGQVTLKHGETVTIPDLYPSDHVYMAELNSDNMNQFDVPQATRTYTIIGGAQQTEDIPLSADFTSTQADTNGWVTGAYSPGETDVITFENTPKKRNLVVTKVWEGEQTSHDPITFTVQATIVDGEGSEQPYDVAALKNEDGSDKEFTLGPGVWTQTIEGLPVMAPSADSAAGKEITYRVTERRVPGYETTYTQTDEGWTITNTPPVPGEITVVKQWLDSKGDPLADHPDSIQYTVYQYSHAHEWGAWVDGTWVKDGWTRDVEPTEETEGHEYQVCKYDDSHRNERVVAKLAHTHDWVITVVPPTCTEQGYTQYHCTKDSTHDYRDNYTAPTGHAWDEGVVTMEPTCTTQGVKTYTCQNDPTHTKIEMIDPLGHDWGPWTVTQEPTTTTEGERTRTCNRCGAVEIQPIPIVSNVYPGTTIPLDELTNWPTSETYPNDMTVTPNQNTQVSFDTSGIFEYNGEYYAIYKAIPAQPAGNFFGGPQNFIGSLNVVKLSGRIVTSTSWNGTMTAGDLYIADNGAAYVLTNNNNLNNLQQPPNDPNMERWYCVYTPSAGRASGLRFAPSPLSEGTGALTPADPVASAADDAMEAVDDGQAAGTLEGTANDVATTEALPGDDAPVPAALPARGAPVSTTNLSITGLMASLGVSELNVIDPTTGNLLAEYAGDGSVTRILDTTGGQTSWSADISAPLEDADGNPYTYYVVETDPAADSEDWDTTYDGQENGLGDGGVVTITNREKAKDKDVVLKKVGVDNTGAGGGEVNLADVEFTITDEGGAVITVDGVALQNLVSGNDGVFYSGKLPLGTYLIDEVEAPAGYNKLSGPLTLVVSEDGVVVNSATAGGQNSEGYVTWEISEDGKTTIYTVTIKNVRGFELPMTGGSGTQAFTIMGVLLAMICSVLAAHRRAHVARERR